MYLTSTVKYSIDNFKLVSNYYFLTHFHADHYQGLNNKFNSTIYCTQTTANLAMKTFRIKPKHFIILNLYTWHNIEPKRHVMLVDANHCPGAACFIFNLEGKFYFHCGDFRCSKEFYEQFSNNELLESKFILKKKATKDEIIHSNFNLKKIKIDEIVHVENKVNIKNTGKSVQFDIDEYTDITESIYIKNQCKSENNSDSEVTFIGERKRNFINSISHTVENQFKYSKIEKSLVNGNIKVANHQEKTNENFLPPYSHILSILYDSIFIDNTYEGFQNFKTQEETIHTLLRLIDKKLCSKNYLIKPKICFLFATYCVGKEKIFFTVAEYLDYTIYANNYKMERLNCISEEIRLKLHFQVDEILQNYNQSYKMSPDIFSRLTNKESNENQIRLVSMANIKSTLYDQTKDLKCDRVCIFIGTGWHEKTEYKNFIKSDGSIVKLGIEIIYFPYSEHSSSDELMRFKNVMKTKNIINTVKNKGKVTQYN